MEKAEPVEEEPVQELVVEPIIEPVIKQIPVQAKPSPPKPVVKKPVEPEGPTKKNKAFADGIELTIKGLKRLMVVKPLQGGALQFIENLTAHLEEKYNQFLIDNHRINIEKRGITEEMRKTLGTRFTNMINPFVFIEKKKEIIFQEYSDDEEDAEDEVEE
jgi:hypothetical protein